MLADGRIAGVDEVGRGPLAGPVMAAAVVLPRLVPAWLAGLLGDSKQLSVAAREAAYAALMAARADGLVQIAVGAASVTEIWRLNILQASLLAMRRAVAASACCRTWRWWMATRRRTCRARCGASWAGTR